MRIYRLALLLLVLLASGCLLPDSGGCPWTETSAVTVEPANDCLELALADASGTGASTGCVNPVLVGTNRCDATLILPPEAHLRGDVLEVAPGEAFTYQVSLEQAVEAPDNHFSFELPAHLDEAPIRIEFTTWRD